MQEGKQKWTLHNVLRRRPKTDETGYTRDFVIKPQTIPSFNKGGVDYTHLDLVERISKNREVHPDIILEIMLYNCITIMQMAEICGVSIKTIHKLTKSSLSGGKVSPPELSVCYPFRTSEKHGPIFIYRDKACVDYIIKKNIA